MNRGHEYFTEEKTVLTLGKNKWKLALYQNATFHLINRHQDVWLRTAGEDAGPQLPTWGWGGCTVRPACGGGGLATPTQALSLSNVLTRTQNNTYKTINLYHFYFFKDFIYSFLERREGREKEIETSMWDRWIGGLAHSLGMCPDWESNRWPLGSQAGTQSTEPHWPRLYHCQ